MGNKTVSMLRIRKLIQLLERGCSARQMSAELKMGRNIVSGYMKRVAESGKSSEELLGLDDALLSSLLVKHNQPVGEKVEEDERFVLLEPLLPAYAQELRRTGVTKQLLWEEYKRDYPSNSYGYTQFKLYLNHYIKDHSYVFHNVYHPGIEMQVDFAGDGLSIIDKGGVAHTCPVLVCSLPFSGYTFAIALFDARQESFYYALDKALEYIGGVTQSVKSDNMKQWVTRADRYEPTFADATLAWGVHYSTELVAARVYKPRDKGHVEGHVHIIYQRIHARLRNERFSTLNALNSRILELLNEHNAKPMQGHSYSRHDRFINEEKRCLKALPTTAYLFKYRKTFTVNSTYHVQIASDEHFYSIPFRHVGKQATLVYDHLHVEIYIGLERIAAHPRNWIKGGYSTLEEHMPENHRAYKKAKEYNAYYYLHRASLVGPCTKQAVERILSTRIFVQQSYRSCQGVLSLTRNYTSARVEAACQRAIQSPVVSYTMIKNILEKKLDMAEYTDGHEQDNSDNLSDHENLRGSSNYK
jgi:transposase